MKRVFLVIFLLPFSVLAQKNLFWFSVSPSASVGETLIVHQESFNSPNITYKFSYPSYNFGFDLNVLYNNIAGFGLSAKYNELNQFYYLSENQQVSSLLATYKNFNYELFFKLKTLTGFIFELGGGVYQTKNFILHSPDGAFLSVDVAPHIYDFVPVGSLNLGFSPFMSQLIDLDLGLNFNYTLKNIMTDNFYITSNYFVHHLENFYDPEHYIATMFVFMRLSYYFGYYGKAGCGKRAFIRNRSVSKLRRF